jgi:Tol biopolymer transport system component
MKTKANNSLLLIIIICHTFSITLMIGCTKEVQEKNYWPNGLEGKFVFSTLSNSVDGRTWHNYYVMDGNGITQINDVFSEGLTFRWSPDGTKLIATYPLYFYILNAATGTLLKKIEGRDPIVSPDGKKIAYRQVIYSSGVRIGDSICTVNPDGTGLLHLNFMDKYFYNLLTLTEWSPDGTKFAFHTNNPNNYFYPDSVGFINADGFTILAKGANPRWSTDCTQLYFYHANAMMSIALSNHSIRKLADMPENTDHFYQWSPDNKKIVCSDGYKTGNTGGNIYLINVESNETAKLANCSFYTGNFCWSSDGKTIAYISGPRDFKIINADGSDKIAFSIGQEVFDPDHHSIGWLDWH